MSEPEEPLDNPEHLSRLDDIIEELPGLDPELQRHLLALIQVVHNHSDEPPFHIALAELEKIRPGTADKTLNESETEAAWDRQNRRIYLFSNIFWRGLARIAGAAVMLFGIYKAFDIIGTPNASVAQVIGSVFIAILCVGGPLAASQIARNSGINIGRNADQTEE